jgi:cell division protein ZapA (FtsZ GTPase activity inhibitor)
MTIKHIATLLSLIFLPFSINAASQASPNKEKPHIDKPHPQKSFPRHWGVPPRIQVRDHVKLPAKFGFGSSTLAKWIAENLKKDADKGKPKPQPKPKPKPPVKPTEPIVPLPPVEIRDKIESFHRGQKVMQDGLKEKITELGKKPSREDVRKAVEQYKKDNKQLMDSQKELGTTINEWRKDHKPSRPQRPELTPEVKGKISSMKEKQKELDLIRKEFHNTLKTSKDLSKESREELIKEFKELNAEKHQALKNAQKEVQKEIRQTKQDGARRK